MVRELKFGPKPRVGERILVLREEWLEHILDGSKSLEIRGLRLRAGDIWLGCRSVIYGKARLGPAIARLVQQLGTTIATCTRSGIVHDFC